MSDVAAEFGRPLIDRLSSFSGGCLWLAPERLNAAPIASGSTSAPRIEAEGGVLAVEVSGFLVARASEYTYYKETAYDSLAHVIREAAEDPDIRAVVLEIDTPGGDARSVDTVTEAIEHTRVRKPVFAYVRGLAASAGYYIAAAASQITAAPDSDIGSIGAIYTHVSEERLMRGIGLDVTIVKAGLKKDFAHPYVGLSPAAKQEAQRRIDLSYDNFVAHVAHHRRISEGVVRGTEAGIYSAADALSLGLIDEVMSMHDFYEGVANMFQKSQQSQTQVSQTQTPQTQVPQTQTQVPQTQTQVPQTQTQVPQTQTQVPQTQTQAPQTQTQTPQTQTPQTQTQVPQTQPNVLSSTSAFMGALSERGQERQRIQAILSEEGADANRALAEHLAFNTTMDAGEVRSVLAAAGSAAPELQTSQVSAFEQKMMTLKDPDLTSRDPSQSEGGGSDADELETFIQDLMRVS